MGRFEGAARGTWATVGSRALGGLSAVRFRSKRTAGDLSPRAPEVYCGVTCDYDC